MKVLLVCLLGGVVVGVCVAAIIIVVQRILGG